MKEITAYIRPEQVDDVVLALEKVGIRGMTIIDVHALAQWADPMRVPLFAALGNKENKLWCGSKPAT